MIPEIVYVVYCDRQGEKETEVFVDFVGAVSMFVLYCSVLDIEHVDVASLFSFKKYIAFTSELGSVRLTKCKLVEM